MKSILAFLLLSSAVLSSQNFSRKDSLQGGIRPERTCFDVLHYNLELDMMLDKKAISGFNEVKFKIVEPTKRIQLDLFENMKVDSIVFHQKQLKYKRDEGAVFIEFDNELQLNTIDSLKFYYSGVPKIAKRAPWDGGQVAKQTSKGGHFCGIAVQGTGASLWYPVKEVQWDEPDFGARMALTVPSNLMAISNGKLKAKREISPNADQWIWEVKNPINTYNITYYIADYVHLKETHNGLDLDYYVLESNLELAKKQFQQVKTMLDCFEENFGPYPFKEDGFKLVEAPYLGMEHQSAIAYGNRYRNGYLGQDLSGTGIGLKFDYIIIHESGHEWFGNSITSKDIADMWIHEGFTMYSEAVFVECTQGKEKAIEYMNGVRKNIRNDKPIKGKTGVNNEGSGDMYPKGAWLVFTMRNLIDNDEIFKSLLKKFVEDFKHKTIDYNEIVSFFNTNSKLDLTKVFEQYVTDSRIPKLVFEKKKTKTTYRWDNVVPGFNMPVDVTINGNSTRIFPTEKPQEFRGELAEIQVKSELFLIDVKGLIK